jgi:catechol 2,3-dioxygenase-like lactoylglutathione lyase family enzyme
MKQTLALISLLVRDYDEAIAYYRGALGFTLDEDTPMGGEKRWVIMAPPGSQCRLLLAKAANPAQAARIGDQTGGRVFLFLHTEDFDRDYARYQQAGVRFIGAPRDEPYGKVIVFEDLYGNKWDLVQPV